MNINNVIKYLEQTGWNCTSKKENWMVFEKDNETIDVLLSEKNPVYKRYCMEILFTLSRVEKRKKDLIEQDINGIQ